MFYHASPLSNLSNILRLGLRPSGGKIYLSCTPEAAMEMAEDIFLGCGSHEVRSRDWVLFGVSLEGTSLVDFCRDPDSDYQNYYAMAESNIPSSAIRVISFFSV